MSQTEEARALEVVYWRFVGNLRSTGTLGRASTRRPAIGTVEAIRVLRQVIDEYEPARSSAVVEPNARTFTRWFLLQDRGKQADWIRSVYPSLSDLLGNLTDPDNRAALSSGVASPEPGLRASKWWREGSMVVESDAGSAEDDDQHFVADAATDDDAQRLVDWHNASLAALSRGVASPTKTELREALSGAVNRAGLYEVADAMVAAILDGTFADASEEQVRHAVYELVAKSAIESDEPVGVASQPTFDFSHLGKEEAIEAAVEVMRRVAEREVE